MNNKKAPLALVLMQLAYAGMVLLSKAALSDGMNALVFVTYRQAIATIVLACFAFALEREKAPSLTFCLFCKIFLLTLCGLTLSMNLYYMALRFTSATFASAILNTIPVIAFIVSFLLRMETIDWSKIYGWFKILGVVMSVGGALVLCLYQGPSFKLLHRSTKEGISTPATHVELEKKKTLLKGAVLMFISTIAWSVWLVFQAEMLKLYPAKLRLTTLQSLLSAVQSAVVAAAFERNPSSWRLGWDIQLLTLAYCGVVVTGVSYGLQIWCIEKKGPFYVAIFSPLSLLITAIFSAFVWAEQFYCGSALGGVLIVGGLYCVLWGKNKEMSQSHIMVTSEPPKEKVADVESG